MEVPKRQMQRGRANLAELSSAHAVRKQNVSLYKPVTLNERNYIVLVCDVINILLTATLVSLSISFVCEDLGRDSPIQTDLALLIKCLLHGKNKNN